MAEIFISYARSAAVQAARIADALRAAGHRVWIWQAAKKLVDAHLLTGVDQRKVDEICRAGDVLPCF